jgi:hypothetical protein
VSSGTLDAAEHGGSIFGDGVGSAPPCPVEPGASQGGNDALQTGSLPVQWVCCFRRDGRISCPTLQGQGDPHGATAVTV